MRKANQKCRKHTIHFEDVAVKIAPVSTSENRAGSITFAFSKSSLNDDNAYSRCGCSIKHGDLRLDETKCSKIVS